jgi:hypothetical protein
MPHGQKASVYFVWPGSVTDVHDLPGPHVRVVAQGPVLPDEPDVPTA